MSDLYTLGDLARILDDMAAALQRIAVTLEGLLEAMDAADTTVSPVAVVGDEAA